MKERNLRNIASKLGIRINHVQKQQWLMASCPFAPWKHPSGTDSDPSFGMHINEEGTSAYSCFTCKSKGRMSSLVRALEHYRGEDYGDLAIEADRADFDIVLPDFAELQARGAVQVLTSLDEVAYGDVYPSVVGYPEAMAYLATRGTGLSAVHAKELDLRYDPEDRRIVFMVRDRPGGLYGFTGRTILPEEQYPRRNYVRIKDYMGLPKEHMLLGAHRVVAGKPVLVVEGLMGYACLISIGAEQYFNVVCLLGSIMTDSKADMLCEWGLPVYLLPDNDEAGDQCLFGTYDPVGATYSGEGAIRKLQGNVPLFVPVWPQDKDDPDQLTLSDLSEMLRNTAPYI